MTEGAHEPEYRPHNDPSHDKELRRMIRAEKMLAEGTKLRHRHLPAVRAVILRKALRGKDQSSPGCRYGLRNVLAAWTLAQSTQVPERARAPRRGCHQVGQLPAAFQQRRVYKSASERVDWIGGRTVESAQKNHRGCAQ